MNAGMFGYNINTDLVKPIVYSSPADIPPKSYEVLFAEEFNNKSIDSGWQSFTGWQNSFEPYGDGRLINKSLYININDRWPSYYVLDTGKSGVSGAGASRALAIPNGRKFSATAKFSFSGWANYHGCWLYLMSNVINTQLRIGLEYRSAGPNIYLDTVSAGTWAYDVGSSGISIPNGQGTIYVHIERDTASTPNWYCYYSDNGLSWKYIGTSTNISTMIIQKVGFVLVGNGAGRVILGIDWFRVNWLFLNGANAF